MNPKVIAIVGALTAIVIAKRVEDYDLDPSDLEKYYSLVQRRDQLKGEVTHNAEVIQAFIDNVGDAIDLQKHLNITLPTTGVDGWMVAAVSMISVFGIILFLCISCYICTKCRKH